LHDAAMPMASLRSLLLICIFKAALACLASMQMTGSPSLFSLVYSHVDVAPVSSPIHATSVAFDLMNAAIASGSERTRLRAQSFPSDQQCRSLLASEKRPIRHNAPLQLSLSLRGSKVSLIDTWRADSRSLSMALVRNYPMCENPAFNWLARCSRTGFVARLGSQGATERRYAS